MKPDSPPLIPAEDSSQPRPAVEREPRALELAAGSSDTRLYHHAPTLIHGSGDNSGPVQVWGPERTEMLRHLGRFAAIQAAAVVVLFALHSHCYVIVPYWFWELRWAYRTYRRPSCIITDDRGITLAPPSRLIPWSAILELDKDFWIRFRVQSRFCPVEREQLPVWLYTRAARQQLSERIVEGAGLVPHPPTKGVWVRPRKMISQLPEGGQAAHLAEELSRLPASVRAVSSESLRIPLATVLAVTLCAPARATVLIDTNFGAPGVPIPPRSAPPQKIVEGELPEPWHDNSEFNAEVNVRYQRLQEGGRTFLRMRKLARGVAQFQHDLPALQPGTYIRITLTARSLNSVSPTVGIRLAGAPYTFFWQAQPGLAPRWQQFEYTAQVSPAPAPIGLWIVLSDEGTLDLASFRMETLTRDELAAEIRAQHPTGGSGNLARITRFPLGLQSGWAVDRDVSEGEDAQLTPDPAVPGPSRAPSLHLLSARTVPITSCPVDIPWSFDRHVASLWLRGDAEGRLAVVAGGAELAARAFHLTGREWQRLQLPFDPQLLSHTHSLRIESRGSLWIDALQVERGEIATPYRSAQPDEVSLSLPPSDAAVARIQFTDEPAVVRFCVTGPAVGQVHARVVNLYGESQELPPQPRANPNVQYGIFRYAVLPRHPLGSFRLEAWVTDARGRTVSSLNELVIQRLRRPRLWGKDAPASQFGTHVSATRQHLTLAKAVGVNWARLHDAGVQFIGWSFLEPEKGHWQFQDAAIHRYRAGKIELLGLLSTAPGWATAYQRPATDYFDRYLEPLHLPDWLTYVNTVTTRYKGVIPAYDVWNEPWGDGYWTTSFDPATGKMTKSPHAPEEYQALQAATYHAAKAVNPTLTILGFNTEAGGPGPEWTRRVAAAGGVSTSDAICYHDYTNGGVGFPGDELENGYHNAVGSLLRSGQPPRPVWMTEGNATNHLIHEGFYSVTVPGPRLEQPWVVADRTARYVLSVLSHGVRKVFLYSMDAGGAFTDDTADWRTLVTDDGYPDPSAAAHSALAWLLEGAVCQRAVTLAPGVTGWVFQAPGRRITAISTAPNHAPYTLPRTPGARLYDLFGNPLTPGSPGPSTTVYLEERTR